MGNLTILQCSLFAVFLVRYFLCLCFFYHSFLEECEFSDFLNILTRRRNPVD